MSGHCDGNLDEGNPYADSGGDILKGKTGKKRNRRFLCRELLEALEEETKIEPTS